jgi:hypothetical protein
MFQKRKNIKNNLILNIGMCFKKMALQPPFQAIKNKIKFKNFVLNSNKILDHKYESKYI